MYALDTTAAKQADQTGKYLNETGKYVGRFIKAEALTAKTGTQGIAFTFETESKQVANFSIYTLKANGEKLPSFKTLMALMACMRLRNVSDPVMSTATKYDYDAKQDVQYQAPLLLDLMNKPVGVILQSCEYEKTKDKQPTGEYGWRLELQGAFEASTELTASEILGGKTVPEMLANMVSHLADRPLKNKGAARFTTSAQSAGGALVDDEIPFSNPYRGRLSLFI